MKKTLLLSILSIFSLVGFSATKTSTATGGNWNTGASWVGGVIPSSTDDVVIVSGATVNITTAKSCKSLTVSGILKWNANVALTITANYVLNTGASESGTGTLQFNTGTGNTLTVTGTTSPTVKYYFNANRTILSPSVVNKTGSTTQINNTKTLTNEGTFTMGSMLVGGSSAKFINGVNATLNLTINNFMSTGLFDCSFSGNTVVLNYVSGNVPNTMSGYYNLSISGSSGTKSIAQNTTVAHNLLISSGNTLNSNNFTLDVKGDWTNNGSFTASVGKAVTLDGTSLQTMFGTGTTTFDELTINNTAGVTISTGSYLLNSILTLNNGTFTSNGNFTLVSTAIKTARIAQVTGTGAFSGNFIIQRFISGRARTWSDLASPVASTTFADWANELYAISYNNSPPNATPTQYFFSESLQDWVPITTSGTTILKGQGVEVFLSGDFSLAAFPNTTINTVGVPNSGNQNLSSVVSFAGTGENLVGNPFASSIDWSTVLAASSHLSSTYDVYNATAGTYATYGAGTEIGAGQGFWVYSTASSPTLIINENAKTTSINSSIKSSIINPYFALKVSSNDPENTFYHILKLDVNANNSNGWEIGKDHPYRSSPNKLAPFIYTAIDGHKSVINCINSLENIYDMPITIGAGMSGSYRIEASSFENLGDFNCVYLEDTKAQKIIDLNSDKNYNFFLNSNESTDRFIVHFSKTGYCKSSAPATFSVNSLNNKISVFPSATGNLVNFNFDETTLTNISVLNILGQPIIDNMNIEANTQSVNISLPENFKGFYFVKIESSKGIVTEKFVRH